MRKSGILLPVFSLPGPYGIGCFSRYAYGFADQLKEAGQTYWQILPLGPTSYGDSPYQSYSTFAGNPYFIDLEELIKMGLLTKEECEEKDLSSAPDQIDYGKLYENRFPLLKTAFERTEKGTEEFNHFREQEKWWLDDYSLYMAIKESQNGKSWIEWPKDLKDRNPEAIASCREELEEEILFYQYLQFWFFTQWDRLKEYVNRQGIQIIGDIPIYVAFDSADTWAHPELFQFDEEKNPAAVAGCPPDGFSATGQLWGNPLYRWDYHKETEYSWWISRISHSCKMYDIIRIDHFRGFDSYYSIPYGAPDASSGHWEQGPGIDFFSKVEEKLGRQSIIAEDLGYLTDSVKQLVKDTGFPGMKIIQFAFDSREESDYLPHNYEKNCVVYTGTHDNDTLIGWYEALLPEDQIFALEYLGREENNYWDYIRLALASVANTAIIPMNDYLGKGTNARINQPSTLGKNWKWRMQEGEVTKDLLQQICKMTRIYKR